MNKTDILYDDELELDTAAEEVEEIIGLDPQDPLYVVGIGASAGGLEALETLLSNMNYKLENVALVVVQHLSPTYKSMLVELLTRKSEWEVIQVTDGMQPEPRSVYITPPNADIILAKGVFKLSEPADTLGPKPSVNTFLYSLAEEKYHKAIAIILSGTGTDGAKGIVQVKEAGGVTIVQEPNTCKYNGMPLSAIDTGCVDFILPTEDIGEELTSIVAYMHEGVKTFDNEKRGHTELKKLYDLLTERTGTNFSNYKQTTFGRRLEKRLMKLKIANLADYLDYIAKEPRELDELFATLLIGVTAFFRDKEAFDSLGVAINKTLATKKKYDKIRIWCAGCATGEEPYTVAIQLHEILGDRLKDYDIQVFATDIDETAINFGRQAVYSHQSLKELDDKIIKKYFIPKGDKFELSKSVRQMVLFTRHDLTSNPPFLRQDLILCRNLLIYFNQEQQNLILPIFHYALNPNGYLFLGKSETVGQFNNLFEGYDHKNKIFNRKVGTSLSSVRIGALKPVNQSRSTFQAANTTARTSILESIKTTLYHNFEHPYVVITDTADIIEINGDVSSFLRFSSGAMNANLLKLCALEIQIDVRALLMKYNLERKKTNTSIKRININNKDLYYRMVLRPLEHSNTNSELSLLVFETFDFDESLLIANSKEYSSESNPRIHELETELEATREHLETFIEELATSNEELQSLNEELQSTNEELQSSNEELETSNEELQSMNEEMDSAYLELQSVHDELEKKEHKLRISDANFRALLNNSMQILILVDAKYNVVSFNQPALEYALRHFDRKLVVGDSIIDIIFPNQMSNFQYLFRQALLGEPGFGEEKINTQYDESLYLRYSYQPAIQDNGIIYGVSIGFLDVTQPRNYENDLVHSKIELQHILDASNQLVFLVDLERRITYFNQNAFDYYQLYAVKKLEKQMRLEDELDENFLGKYRENLDRAVGGQKVEVRRTLPTKVGDVDANILYSPIFNADGQVVSVAIFMSHQLIS